MKKLTLIPDHTDVRDTFDHFITAVAYPNILSDNHTI